MHKCYSNPVWPRVGRGKRILVPLEAKRRPGRLPIPLYHFIQTRKITPG